MLSNRKVFYPWLAALSEDDNATSAKSMHQHIINDSDIFNDLEDWDDEEDLKTYIKWQQKLKEEENGN